MTAVYSNDFIVTQVDDGITGGAGDCTSSSMPSIVLAMLTALDVHEGQRVLETGTGTGTGYSAALLAHRLSADHVVSEERIVPGGPQPPDTSSAIARSGVA